MDVLGVMGHSLFLWPVLLCAIAAVAITLERAFYLFFRAYIAPGPFMSVVQKLVLAGELDRAIRVCNAEPKAPLPNVVKTALLHAGDDREDLELAVEQATLDAIPEVQARIGYLPTLANIATLLGLLGTIVGLIQSFAAVAEAEPLEKQTMLAKGIATAMYATAGGISVAIPALLAYTLLVARANRILDDVERYGAKTMMLVVARQKGTRLDEAAP